MKNLILVLVVVLSVPTSVSAGNVKPIKVVELFSWLNKNLSYPAAAAENKEEGVVYVSFTISEEGTAENVKIKAGISESLNTEALKTVKKMPLVDLYDALDAKKEYVLPVRFSIK